MTGPAFRAGLATALLLCGTAATSAAEKKHLYFVPNGAVDFWKLAEAGMKKALVYFRKFVFQIYYR